MELTKIKMAKDLSKVFIAWNKTTSTEKLLGNGTEEDGEDESEKVDANHEYTVKGKHRPHKDFVDSMKSLRKFALELYEVEIESTKIASWNVFEIAIAGDVFLKKSRATFILAHLIKATGKYAETKLSQVTMYPEKDETDRYHNAEKMSKAIEKCIEEAFKYLNGKYEEDDPDQLPLFSHDEKLELHFTK